MQQRFWQALFWCAHLEADSSNGKALKMSSSGKGTTICIQRNGVAICRTLWFWLERTTICIQRNGVAAGCDFLIIQQLCFDHSIILC